MKALVTGSAGHLGEAMVRSLQSVGQPVLGLDIQDSPFTHFVGTITDREVVRACLAGVDTVYHTATLHKPHVATHSPQQFVDTNITGTLLLLEEAVAAGVKRFVFTSTTSAFGDALIPPVGSPAEWVTEGTRSIPKNIYGVTKEAAENLCQLYYRNFKLPCIVLRTSRFFPEDDDNQKMREQFSSDNLKANEYLFRRVDIEDTVSALLVAAEKAPEIGFGKYIISATTPFSPADAALLRTDAPMVVKRLFPEYEEVYRERGWKMFHAIDRVYDNTLARTELGWQPRHDFGSLLARLRTGGSMQSPLAQLIGSKGYHEEEFTEGPYPVH
ncbi:NAD-dependent epimerase/dehydratase family protein [Puia dinghuensis]|uniref:NAD-dependent epimerase n=1 Tax=Puia dinghuensis TaxID=1792502 RepID=A0A8J2XTI9_9BACT|nr:NAD(P)-dependent oxidoreductase [Puia dinghuensis]GGB03753.1 NAD-dependent epimerase [Puia dinghuensis]